MSDKRYKKRVNISLDPNVHKYIKEECEKNGMNFSQWVTLQVYDYKRKQYERTPNSRFNQ